MANDICRRGRVGRAHMGSSLGAFFGHGGLMVWWMCGGVFGAVDEAQNPIDVCDLQQHGKNFGGAELIVHVPPLISLKFWGGSQSRSSLRFTDSPSTNISHHVFKRNVDKTEEGFPRGRSYKGGIRPGPQRQVKNSIRP
jgi:hypothetical protein